MVVDVFLNNSLSYNFSILFLNIIVYSISMFSLFLVISCFDFKSIKNLTDLSCVFNFKTLQYVFLVSLFSLSGVPPFMGFFGKMFMFFLIVSKLNYFLTCAFLFTNLFVVYFYMQNLRFITSGNTNKQFKFHINFKIASAIFCLTFISVFFIFFVEFFFIKINSIFVFLNF